MLDLLTGLVRAVDARVQRKPGGWAGDDGMEVAQALALAAFGIFAIIAIFAVFQANAIQLVQDLFNRISGGG